MPKTSEARESRARRAAERRSIEVERNLRGRNVWWRRGVRIVRRGLANVLVRLLLPATLRLLVATLRVERRGFEHVTEAEATGHGFLIAIWHGDMLAPMPLHRRRGTGVLVSPSGDGALVKMVLERYGYHVIRGSTNRGSARALREMQAHLGDRGSVVITPDGPRGPRHSMNLGLAWLARETGCPIVTVRVEIDRAWELKSWDRFRIPKPRANVVLHYEPARPVAADADEAELERITETIRRQLLGPSATTEPADPTATAGPADPTASAGAD